MKPLIKTFLEFLLVCFLRVALWFRYRVTVKGLENLNPTTLNKSGGVLFLPNHCTVFIDSTLIVMALWPKFHIRPMIVEYMYYLPIVNSVMRLLDAVPIPNFSTSTNSVKKKKSEKVMQTVMHDLRDKKDNFMIFPAGRLKLTNLEAIDGASGVHQIVQEVPEANIVLVRVKGLWGSSFSRAQLGKTPPFFGTVINGVKIVLKNLLFFTPRREVIIEFVPAPANFPYKANRLEFNKYLEQWYNLPDGLAPHSEQYPGDSLILVPYSIWDKKATIMLAKPPTLPQETIDIDSIPLDIQKKVRDKLADLTSFDPANIKPEMSLAADLGLDSLDMAELSAFLQDQFDIETASTRDFTSVGKLMAIASKQVTSSEEGEEEEETNLTKWNAPRKKTRAHISFGSTIPEVFLNTCSLMGNALACADMRSGVVTYSQLKLRTLILADYIRTLPGQYVGILLPASTAASMTILACQIAGKTPLMVNWTIGPRHLQSVVQLSKVQTVLTSWAFLERLQNADLTGVDDKLVMLEDVRKEIGIAGKLKGYFLSKRNTQSILKAFGYQSKPHDPAVLLFTSGTENLPKGVPLSHENILSNQRACLNAIDFYTDDVVYGILPPFHSFGFTISGLTGLLSGVRVAFSPDPTDGLQLAKGFARWGVTVVCGAPTFIKKMLRAATPEQLKTMRLCITGAEKLPQDLIQTVEKLGKGSCLMEGYGITECAPVLTYTPQGQPRKGVGKPLPGNELCIVNPVTHALLPIGEQGLILARGPNVFSGYINGQASPFLTLNNQQWYMTGDLGFLEGDGTLNLSGRLKRFIKVGGEMVSLASIEDALMPLAANRGSPEGEDGPVLGITAKEIPGDKPKIFLFCKFSTDVDEANKTLRDAGFSNLVKITTVKQMNEIPIMGTGKVNYRALEAL